MRERAAGLRARAAAVRRVAAALQNGFAAGRNDSAAGRNREKFDGVLVESLREGDDGWQSLGLDSYSPYIDDRPPKVAGKPEMRQYRARYILRDQATGEWSDIVTVTFVP